MNVLDGSSMVLETLSKAASQNTELFKPAEQQLKQWETEPGFYSTLLSIFFNHSIDRNVRWLAVLYFKNGVERYWRKTAPNAISEEEKKIIKDRLISNFREPVNQLAVQLAVLISKVARFDCPKEWPELIPTLLQSVRDVDDLCQQRTLLVLHHVIKALSSKRLAGDRRIFHELTSNIFNYVLNLWNSYTEAFLQHMQQEQFDVGVLLEKSHLSLKVIRKLVVHGFKEPGEVQDAVTFLSLVFQIIKPFLECRKTFQGQNYLAELSEKYVILLTKVLHDVLEVHPFSYVPFIKPTLECAVTLCFTDDGQGLLFERFIVQCFNLVKAILLCAEYRIAKEPEGVVARYLAEESKEQATLDACKIKEEFFNHDTLVGICRRLLTFYFLLTEEDLNCWDTSPEEFAVDEGGEAWKFSLKPCTEVLFLALFHEFRQTVTPVILEMVQNVQNMGATQDLPAILYKDAVYNAVGLTAFDLFGDIDFDNWFAQSLTPELKNKDIRHRIIRRRIIWLAGQWVGVKLSVKNRPMFYEAVLDLLDPQEDLVVKLTAANALKDAVDDFDFSTEQFMPYLEATVNKLYQLLRQVSECDTKMAVLYVLSYVIERMFRLIQPYAAELANYLPLLWETSGDHNMLRCAIISLLVHLVQGLGVLSGGLQSFLLPVISLSTDVSQPCHVYLLEDGLDLWWALLQNTAAFTPELLTLSKNLLPLLELGTENLRTCMQIIQAYILLAPKEFLSLCGNDIVVSSCSLIKDMRSEGITMVMRVVEVIFKVFPEEGPHLFAPILPFVLTEVLKAEDLPTLMSMYLSLISRVVLHNRPCLTTLLQGKAMELGKTEDEIMKHLLKVWLEKMALVQPIERRKLLGLALTSLLTANSGVIHDHFCGLVLAICEVLNDIIKTDDLGACIDSLLVTDNDNLRLDEEDEEETEHEKRKRELARKDPVMTVALREYLGSQMSLIQQNLGPVIFEQLMGTVDSETMESLNGYIFGQA